MGTSTMADKDEQLGKLLCRLFVDLMSIADVDVLQRDDMSLLARAATCHVVELAGNADTYGSAAAMIELDAAVGRLATLWPLIACPSGERDPMSRWTKARLDLYVANCCELFQCAETNLEDN